ncbi:MAG TPA: hypothetical protein VI336_00845 [Candidatus Saccharimonadales bacterium]|nr:hypothetical protein [Candidatus Saccharimonadales bacterium]
MRVLQAQPTLTDLHHLIELVPKYPITTKELIDLARKANLPQAVADFYGAFPHDESFTDKEDLLARTEHVEMMHHLSAPAEEMHDSEQD